MSTELATLLIFSNLVLFLALGFPVAWSLVGVSIGWMALLKGPFILQLVPATIFETTTTEIFIAAPLFIFMAVCLERSGIGAKLYEAIYKWSGGLPGGLAVGTMIAATLIGAMTGVGGTAVLVLGMLSIPAMIRRGYDVSIAIGGLPPGGALGVLIPPTVIGVLLGGFTGIPVGSLFFGGFLPGLVIALGFCGWILLRCLARPELAPPLPPEERPSFAEKLRASRQVAPALALVALVLGTIWFGVATPTEAAGIGAFGTLAIAFLSGAMGPRSLLEALRTSGEVSIMVVSLLIGGSLFTRLLQLSGAARMLADIMIGIEIGPVGMIVLFVLVVTLLGMFIDGSAIIFIVSPIMMPVVQALDVDQVWFGVLMMMAIAAGYVTPPFGMNLFFLKGILIQASEMEGCGRLKSVGMGVIWRACLPYVLIMYGVIGLVLLFPGLATWLPRMMH
ncbi:MAG: TRAP transporter large permease [Albimonas sp.]|uniref:TRAP transporter large permease n=1 Tax=Albimonas sp. TaxID=1872425 RepID=UPI0040563F56